MLRFRKSIWFIMTGLFLINGLGFLSATPEVRIKDIGYIEGIRENQLVGIGLITGLAGKGDSSSSEILKRSISNILNNFGFNSGVDAWNGYTNLTMGIEFDIKC